MSEGAKTGLAWPVRWLICLLMAMLIEAIIVWITGTGSDLMADPMDIVVGVFWFFLIFVLSVEVLPRLMRPGSSPEKR